MGETYKVRGVLFDLDGTLVDSAEDLRAALNVVLGSLSLRAIARREISAMIGDGLPKLIERGLVAAGGDPGQAAVLLPVFLRIYEADPTTRTRCYPGVVDTLAALRALHCRTAVVTNKPTAATHAILRGLRLSDLFDVVVGGDVLPQRKPHPEPLREAARQLGLDPSDLLMVGDNVHDIEAARAAGIASVAVTYGYHHQPPASFGAGRLIDRFGELLPLIRVAPLHSSGCAQSFGRPQHSVQTAPEPHQ